MRRASPVTGALLGLLLERPGYGYELAHRMNDRMGATWKLKPPAIYPVLDRLESKGLVRRAVRDLPGRARQRERVMYHVTDKAPAAFERWLARPPRWEPTRNELLAKIAVARPEDRPRLLEALDEYERQCLRMLQAASDDDRPARGSWGAVLAGLVEAAAEQQLRAELEWVALARRRIAEFAPNGGGR